MYVYVLFQKPFYDSQKSCIASKVSVSIINDYYHILSGCHVNIFVLSKARLADIRSTRENEFVKSITGGTAAWLGATDNGTESHWR